MIAVILMYDFAGSYHKHTKKDNLKSTYFLVCLSNKSYFLIKFIEIHTIRSL